MFKTGSLRLFLPRIIYILDKHRACCFIKRNLRTANIFALKARDHCVMQVAQNIFPHFPQIGCLHRKHRSVVFVVTTSGRTCAMHLRHNAVVVQGG